ncbi:hypothetical protein A3K80_00280 [Candidatus Bathyarchaeota archaeon RBG_13_38_9]|nr:MAG: hypothetical protein A3K80_00280 [Candidatus Bathyarchaeota archaeon RBG_13_38_9]
MEENDGFPETVSPLYFLIFNLAPRIFVDDSDRISHRNPNSVPCSDDNIVEWMKSSIFISISADLIE